VKDYSEVTATLHRDVDRLSQLLRERQRNMAIHECLMLIERITDVADWCDQENRKEVDRFA
jgi:hypothetical protein